MTAWGILSTARINLAVLEGARESEKVDVVAMASREQRTAEAYAREHGIERAHGGYDALLADPDVEAVYISLPNSMHVEWSVRALQAGKHVLCEKPLSRHPGEVDRAFDVAKEQGRLLTEAFMWRHHPQAKRLGELIEDGEIGDLRVIRAGFAFGLDDPEDIRLSAELEGGGLMDVGCYCVSGCRTVAGAEPERVYAEQVVGGQGVDVALAATLRFPGDVLAHFDCGLAYAGGDHLEAVGTAGSLFLDDPWHGRDPVIEVRRADRSMERVETDHANSYALELADFEAAVRGERAPLLGRDDALGQARTIAALYESAGSNEPCPVA